MRRGIERAEEELVEAPVDEQVEAPAEEAVEAPAEDDPAGEDSTRRTVPWARRPSRTDPSTVVRCNTFGSPSSDTSASPAPPPPLYAMSAETPSTGPRGVGIGMSEYPIT